MELVSATRFEVDYVHDTVSLLKQVQRPLVLLSLYEAISAVVKFCHYYWNLVFGDAQLLVVVLVEGVVLQSCLVCSCWFFAQGRSFVSFLYRGRPGC